MEGDRTQPYLNLSDEAIVALYVRKCTEIETVGREYGDADDLSYRLDEDGLLDSHRSILSEQLHNLYATIGAIMEEADHRNLSLPNYEGQ